MILRRPPVCWHCGKVIAEAIYAERSNFIGDTFIEWRYEDHECAEEELFWHKAFNPPLPPFEYLIKMKHNGNSTK